MTDAKISDLLEQAQHPLLSYEFFPPKDDRGVELLRTAATLLLPTRPDFVTCTYGAGGSTRERTLSVCRMLRDMGFKPVMPHLTCVASSHKDLEAVSDMFHAEGFRNIMTLRGDPPKGDTIFQAAEGGLSYASELVGMLMQRHPDFCCGVAGYPETHPEATSAEDDIRRLKEKLDAGGSFVTTQLFFENRRFYDFVDRCRAAGISQPILPGLMPATSYKQMKRISSLCHASFPEDLAEALESAGEDEERAAEIGVDWTVRQIRDLLAHDVPGIHLYILNRARTVLEPALISCFESHRPLLP